MDFTFIYEIQHHAAFGQLIVLYFFLAGLSAGLFMISSLSPVFGLRKFEPLAKPASAMALATLIPGLLALVLDLGQPMRALTLFFRVNPTSIMSWGSFILLIYGIVCLGYTWFLWKEDRRCIAWGKIGVVFAAALGLYTGFLLAVVPGRPLWNSAMLPVLFLVSGGVAALSLLSLAEGFFAKSFMLEGQGSKEGMSSLKIWIVGLEVLLLAFHLLAVLSVSEAGWNVVINLLTGMKVVPFVVIQLIIGSFLPLFILLFSKRSSKALGVAGLLSLIGVFALRYNFVFGGEELPQSGTLLYNFEGGLSGWGLTVGLLALTFVLLYILPRMMRNLTDRKPSVVSSKSLT
ncbi:MAG: NrfD/PsrC family molybdoenzyme membrane anchor subunit [Desulfitobacterium sp.]